MLAKFQFLPLRRLKVTGGVGVRVGEVRGSKRGIKVRGRCERVQEVRGSCA